MEVPGKTLESGAVDECFCTSLLEPLKLSLSALSTKLGSAAVRLAIYFPGFLCFVAMPAGNIGMDLSVACQERFYDFSLLCLYLSCWNIYVIMYIICIMYTYVSYIYICVIYVLHADFPLSWFFGFVKCANLTKSQSHASFKHLQTIRCTMHAPLHNTMF